MKQEITNTELDAIVESTFINIIEVIETQIEDDTVSITFKFDENEILELKVNKEDIVNMICAKIEETLPQILTFDRYDENGDPCFKISDFQKQRVAAYNRLKKSYDENIAYLKDYKYLILSCGFIIVGEISDVKMNQIHEAAYMVDKLTCKHGLILSNFAELKDLYYKDFEV